MDPEDILTDLEFKAAISVIGPLIGITQTRRLDDVFLNKGLNNRIVIKFGYANLKTLQMIYRIFKLYRGDYFEGAKINSVNLWFGIDQSGIGKRDLSLEDTRQIIYSLFAIFDPDKKVSLEFRKNLFLKKLKLYRFYDNQEGAMNLDNLNKVNNLFIQFTFNLNKELDDNTILRSDESILNTERLPIADAKKIPADTQRYLDAIEIIAEELATANLERDREQEDDVNNRYISPETDVEIYELLEELQNSKQFKKSKNVRGKGITFLKRLNHHAKNGRQNKKNY